MANTKKYKILIEQVKKESHELELEGSNLMEVLDAARDMVKKRNEITKNGTFYSVKKIDEIKE